MPGAKFQPASHMQYLRLSPRSPITRRGTAPLSSSEASRRLRPLAEQREAAFSLSLCAEANGGGFQLRGPGRRWGWRSKRLNFDTTQPASDLSHLFLPYALKYDFLISFYRGPPKYDPQAASASFTAASKAIELE